MKQIHKGGIVRYILLAVLVAACSAPAADSSPRVSLAPLTCKIPLQEDSVANCNDVNVAKGAAGLGGHLEPLP